MRERGLGPEDPRSSRAGPFRVTAAANSLFFPSNSLSLSLRFAMKQASCASSRVAFGSTGHRDFAL